MIGTVTTAAEGGGIAGQTSSRADYADIGSIQIAPIIAEHTGAFGAADIT